MPRNGDGSSDNGPIEGQNIVHGDGKVSSSFRLRPTFNTDLSLKPDSQPQHAKNNVAPAPELEKGGAIEGMNASGGGNKADQAEPTVAGDKPAQ
jgi:hypothetical protein